MWGQVNLISGFPPPTFYSEWSGGDSGDNGGATVSLSKHTSEITKKELKWLRQKESQCFLTLQDGLV